MTFCRTSLSLAILAFIPVGVFAQSAEQVEYFEKNVRPVLATSCQPCHNATVKSSGLDLSTAEGFFRGGSGGVIFTKEHPETSRLVKVIGYEDSLKMPPSGKLKPEQIEVLTNWAKMGAPWPGGSAAAATVSAAPQKKFSAEQKAFWAFQPIREPALPTVKDTKWIQSPVDQFVLAKLEERGIHPAPVADKASLLRRATFDLTGLPPTEQEMQDFLADHSPKAFEKVVDRLLASPRYGERWGRHWLDVARYADSTGNDEDHRYPYAWRYRDYVIQSFNNDLPYNQFVREQVAGDLLPLSSDQSLNARHIVATGFLALGAKALAQVDKKKMLYDVWDEQVDVTSKAFLGLTMACARCHDHKFDPILTKDYYSMVGMFASTKSFNKVNQGVASLLYRPLVTEEEYRKYRAYQAKIGLQNLEIEELLDAALENKSRQWVSQIADYMLVAREVYQNGVTAKDAAAAHHLDEGVTERFAKLLAPAKEPRPWLDAWQSAKEGQWKEVALQYQTRSALSLREWYQTLSKTRAESRKKLEAGNPEVSKSKYEGKDEFFQAVLLTKSPFGSIQKDKEKEALASPDVQHQIAELRSKVGELKKSGPSEPAMADAVSEDQPVAQKVLLRGDYNNLGEDAPRSVPTILREAAPPPSTFQGSGRLEVANWLTDLKNPLPARVMVNRIWTWHFGNGIVSTPDNFGKMGGRPSHPELLDYLASEFVENGWSVKKMHRMMMLSSAYQMSTDTDDADRAKDPENALFSRFERQRLSVEEIRDGMLAIDHTLDLTMGGTLQSGFGTDSENSADRLSLNPETIKRRTVYLPLRRANLPTLLNLFDFGDATTVNGKRSLTNVSPQTLFMMNSQFVEERAENVAKSVVQDPRLSNSQRLEAMYVRVLDRKPSSEEIDRALTYMDRFRQKFHTDELEAWQSFCHILLTSNEFIYLD